jgi:lipoprotein-anchoring transpeptidase ErfK/SrfK
VPERPNGKLGWIDGGSSAIARGRTRVSLRADLSRRTVELRVGRRVVERMTVAIGRPGSPTPTGRFAVTDKLSGNRYGPYYGCCILALSGHQPNTPAGWRGGNRLAIHGTNAPGAIGAAASAGCLRGSDADLRTLMRRVPVGTPVFIQR